MAICILIESGERVVDGINHSINHPKCRGCKNTFNVLTAEGYSSRPQTRLPHVYLNIILTFASMQPAGSLPSSHKIVMVSMMHFNSILILTLHLNNRTSKLWQHHRPHVYCHCIHPQLQRHTKFISLTVVL